jgi:apolipoprotein N-acyltransferase
VRRIGTLVVLAWGWRRVLIAFLAGAGSALALPPVGFWLAPFVTFPILVWLLDGAPTGRFGSTWGAAVAGWWFGFGYFLAGLYWIGNAFLVDARLFGWLLPVAVLALPAGMAIYTAFGTVLARSVWTRGPARLLALAGSLTVAEWLRGHLLTGFPWNTFAYTVFSPLWLAQSASLVGTWGLTFFAIVICASPAVLADDPADARFPWLVPALAVTLIVGLAAFGAARLAFSPTSYVDGVLLRVMQPNIKQDAKFDPSQKQRVMRRYLELSDRPNGRLAHARDFTHLIWPESAFPFFLTREPDALAQIAALLRPATVLITGGIRPPESAAIRRAYNSVYAIAADGSILSVYDKVHLVPFGEYLPLQSLLEQFGLRQLTRLRGGFIAGVRRLNQRVPGAPEFVPLVCYEIIFPGAAIPGGERGSWLYNHLGRFVGWPFVTGSPTRPGWMLNVTNDGWFGQSPGPYQHFQQARMRAIEEGLPLVRAANTGISAVTDPLGRIVGLLPLGEEGVLDARLPQALAATSYARVGDAPAAVMVLAAFVVVFRARKACR